jgi:hypothetical protein
MKVDETHGIGIENLDSLQQEAGAPQSSSLISSITNNKLYNKLAEIIGQGFIQKCKHEESEQELQQDKSTAEHQQFQFGSVKSYNSQGCDSKKDTLMIKPRAS